MGAKGKQVVDHINKNKLDNKRTNLRICRQMQNMWNADKKKGASSKHKGVKYNKKDKAFYALITIRGHQWFLGMSKSEDDCALLYNVAAQLFFGEFAKLNDV